MASIEVGIRIDATTGVAFFGIEAVNKQLAAGLKIRELRPGGILAAKEDGPDGNVTLALKGCQIVVVFEAD
jgi:hypothetical protein